MTKHIAPKPRGADEQLMTESCTQFCNKALANNPDLDFYSLALGYFVGQNVLPRRAARMASYCLYYLA